MQKIILQHFKVTQDPDEKGKYLVICKYCSTELCGSTKATTNLLNHLKVLIKVLDPRFKLQWCSQPEKLIHKAALITKAATVCTPRDAITTDTASDTIHDIASCEPPTKKRRGFFSALIDVPSQAPTHLPSIEAEVSDYISQPCLPEAMDPLAFWREHAHKFPSLASIAPGYLSIPASSAPVERLFSIAGKVFRPERCELADSTFETLMFVRCNNSKI